MSLLDDVYRRYADPESTVRKLHRRLFTSPAVVRLLFRLRVRRIAEKPYFFDLTTLLLRHVVTQRLRRWPEGELLEIGVGAYAILSGSVSRRLRRRIDAVDKLPALVESARLHCQMNGLNVNVLPSDLFSGLPPRTYDLIFWNLPYYEPPEGYLRGLFERAPDFMKAEAELLIGYNTTPLPRSVVLRLLAAQPRLRLRQTRTWRWNLHEVLIIGRAGGEGPA